MITTEAFGFRCHVLLSVFFSCCGHDSGLSLKTRGIPDLIKATKGAIHFPGIFSARVEV